MIVDVHLRMRSWGHLNGILHLNLIAFLDFKLSSCSESCMLSSG